MSIRLLLKNTLALALTGFLCGNAMAANLLLQDGFESGNTAGWDCVDLVTTEQTHTGKYALKKNSANYWGCSKFLSAESPTIYMSFWWFIPQGFQWNLSSIGGRHFWRLTNAVGDQYQKYQIDTGPTGGVSKSFELVYFWGGDGPVYRPGTILPEGKWFRFEIYTKLNAPGKSDGVVAVWIDGQQKVNAANQDFHRNGTYGINMLRLNTNYDNCSGTCHWYQDDVEVWDDKPNGLSIAYITTDSLPRGQTGVPYNATLAATGGVAPYKWRIAASSLLPGLVLDSLTGRITGVTMIAQRRRITFEVRDSQNPPSIAAKDIYINIVQGTTVIVSPFRQSQEGRMLNLGKGSALTLALPQAGAFRAKVLSLDGRSLGTCSGTAESNGVCRIPLGDAFGAGGYGGIGFLVLEQRGEKIVRKVALVQ